MESFPNSQPSVWHSWTWCFRNTSSKAFAARIFFSLLLKQTSQRSLCFLVTSGVELRNLFADWNNRMQLCNYPLYKQCQGAVHAWLGLTETQENNGAGWVNISRKSSMRWTAASWKYIQRPLKLEIGLFYLLKQQKQTKFMLFFLTNAVRMLQSLKILLTAPYSV